jgi:hypothetical protein
VVLAAPFLEHGLTFGVVGNFHIRVCMSNSCEPKNVAPPTVRSKEQVAVAKFVLADTFG